MIEDVVIYEIEVILIAFLLFFLHSMARIINNCKEVID